MTKKKKLILIGGSCLFVIAIIAITLSITLFKSNDNVVLSDNENNKNLINNSFLTLMLEQEDGSYLESTTNTWPSENYAFNSELSRCENGGELEWDREQGIVKLLSNKSDACYVYFDLYNVVTITNVSATKTTNSVTLTVTVDAGEHPVATYYFSMDGGHSYETSNTNSYTFSNLDYGTAYTFQVYVVDTEGYESNEEVIEVTTDNYVNPVVNSVTATNVSNNSITVGVNATAGTNAIQTYYYSINNGSYTNSSSNSYTFSGLSAGQSYSIRVYVKDTNGIDSNIYNLSIKTDDKVLLADYIKSKYTSQGENGLYYHTSSLSANSAADNSYRYSGANPSNYVCFGSDATSCPANNLYRIIGVFDSETKLIKNASIGNYVWESDWNGQGNNWTISSRPDIYATLNSTFLNTIPTEWQSKIVTHIYKVGGISYSNGTGALRTAFDYEVGGNSSTTTDSMKIGLMYVSDYGYATISSYWGNSLGSNYNNTTVRNANWLYLGSYEWTISRNSSNSNSTFYINSNGNVADNSVVGSNTIRPVFYLSSDVTYISGTGTAADPYRIGI